MSTSDSLLLAVYKPLRKAAKEIRVLDVLPSLDASAPLHGALRIMTLPEIRPPRTQALTTLPTKPSAHSYETISYAWGDCNKTSAVWLDEIAHSVPASAEAAVRRMRDGHTVRTVWIDSICINQNDLGEKSDQIKIMGDVYACSTCNLIWLGESDETTSSAIQSFKAIYDEILAKTDDLRTWNQTLSTFYAGAHASVFDARSFASIDVEYDLSAIARFYSRPWFSRLWVLQETALAPHNIAFCGSHTLPLLTVLRPVVWLFFHHDIEVRKEVYPMSKPVYEMRQCIDPIDGFLTEARDHDVGSIFLDLTGAFQVTVPHDRVFALLGLVPTSLWQRIGGKRLEPDYNKPISEVIRDAVAAAIQSTPCRDFLGEILHCRVRDRAHSDLASWVPPSLLGSHDNKGLKTFARKFEADQNRQREFVVRQDNLDVLEAMGVTVDVVDKVSGIFPGFANARDLDAWFSTCEQLATQRRVGTETEAQHAFSVAMSSTLVAAGIHERNFSDRLFCDGDERFFQQYWDRLRTVGASASEYDQPDFETASFARSIGYACAGRCFFVTAAGRIGIGHRDIRAGDTVAVVYGEGWPLILSPEDGQFSLAGACYVYGIMAGEALQGDTQERVFHIV